MCYLGGIQDPSTFCSNYVLDEEIFISKFYYTLSRINEKKNEQIISSISKYSIFDITKDQNVIFDNLNDGAF